MSKHFQDDMPCGWSGNWNDDFFPSHKQKKTKEISESRLQQLCYMHLHNSYPHLRGLFFRIKNEGYSAITGARDKAMGILPGVADSCLLIKGTAIFIEFKSEIGRQSPTQKTWQATVEAAGYQYFIIRNLNEFKDLCRTLNL